MGKAQEAYSALSIEDSGSYDKVKGVILKAYELVLEDYSQRFCGFVKTDSQIFVEFAKEKESLFDRWCQSQNVEAKDDLRQLILVGELKNRLPQAACIYLNEQSVVTVEKAAVLADEFHS